MTITTLRQMIAGAVALASAVAFAQPGLAQGKGGANAGGNSAGHISTQGLTNSNGPNARDRDTGLDRASDRANTSAEGKLPSSHQLGQRSSGTGHSK